MMVKYGRLECRTIKFYSFFIYIYTRTTLRTKKIYFVSRSQEIHPHAKLYAANFAVAAQEFQRETIIDFCPSDVAQFEGDSYPGGDADCFQMVVPAFIWKRDNTVRDSAENDGD